MPCAVHTQLIEATISTTNMYRTFTFLKGVLQGFEQ